MDNNHTKIIKEIALQTKANLSELQFLNTLFNEEAFSTFVSKNHNGDFERAFKVVKGEELKIDDSLREKIPFFQESVDMLSNYLSSSKKVLICGDFDNDGTIGITGFNLLNLSFDLNNIHMDYAKISKQDKPNHGITYSWLENKANSLNISSEEDFLIFTSDNGSGIENLEDIEKMLENYMNAKFLVTDHHHVDPYFKTLLEKYPDRFLIFNPTLAKQEDLNNFNYSGAQTSNILIEEFLKKQAQNPNFPTDKVVHLIEQLNNLNDISVLLDLVKGEKIIDSFSTIKKIQNLGNKLNALKDWSFLLSSNNPKDILKNVFNLKDNKIEDLIQFLNLILHKSKALIETYPLVKNGQITDKETLNKKLINYLPDTNKDYIHQNNKLYSSSAYLRPIAMDFISKKNLKSLDEILNNYLTNIFNDIKSFEKIMAEESRNEKSSFIDIFEKENTKIIFSKKSIPRKLIAKFFPSEYNKALTVTMDGFNQEVISGSFRSSQNMSDIRGESNPFNEFITKTPGHEQAGGFSISGKSVTSALKKANPELTIKTLNEKLEQYITDIDYSVTNTIKNSPFESNNTPLVDINALVFYEKMMTVLRTPTSFHNYKFPISIDHKQIVLKNGAADETLEIINSNPILERYATEGWEIAEFDLHSGNAILFPKHLREKIQDEDKNYKIVLEYMAPNILIAKDIVEYNNEPVLRLENPLEDYQKEEYVNLFNKENNYTIEVDKENFINKHLLIDEQEHYNFELAIKDLLKTKNKKEFCILDIEGSGLGRFFKMTELGILRFSLDENDELKLKMTSLKAKVKTSIAIQNLTHLDNKFLSENGLSYKEISKIIDEEFKDGNVIFNAYNSVYDSSGLAANLSTEVFDSPDNLFFDSAYFGRKNKLAMHNKEELSTVSIENSDISLPNVSSNHDDKFSGYNFLKKQEPGSKYNTNDYSLIWQLDSTNNKLKLIKKENNITEEMFSIERDSINSENFEDFFSFSPIDARSKFAVNEIIYQDVAEKIVEYNNEPEEFTRSLYFKWLEDNQNTESFSLYNSILESKYNFIVNNMDLSLSNKDLKSLFNSLIAPESFSSKIQACLVENGKNVDLFKASNISDEDFSIIQTLYYDQEETFKAFRKSKTPMVKRVSKLLIDKSTESFEDISDSLFNFIIKNVNTEYYFQPKYVKSILKIFNYDVSREDNVSFISKKLSLPIEEVSNLVGFIESFNSGKVNFMKQYQDIFDLKRDINFTELSYENHNNSLPEFSDVGKEFHIVFSRLNKKTSHFGKDYFKKSLNYTTLNTLIQLYKRKYKYLTDDSFSLMQLKANQLNNSEHSSTVKREIEKLENNIQKGIIDINVNKTNFILSVNLFDDFNFESQEERELLIKRINTISSDILNLKATLNSYEAKYSTLTKKLEKTEGLANLFFELIPKNPNDFSLEKANILLEKIQGTKRITPSMLPKIEEDLFSIIAVGSNINFLTTRFSNLTEELSSYGTFNFDNSSSDLKSDLLEALRDNFHFNINNSVKTSGKNLFDFKDDKDIDFLHGIDKILEKSKILDINNNKEDMLNMLIGFASHAKKSFPIELIDFNLEDFIDKITCIFNNPNKLKKAELNSFEHYTTKKTKNISKVVLDLKFSSKTYKVFKSNPKVKINKNLEQKKDSTEKPSP